MTYGKFLNDYILFSSGNETPTIFHIWTAISTLAGACEKRLWLERDFFRIYLNLYILFIAPPGVCAKSTSMDLGLKLLKETGYNVLEDSVLKERIIEEMCAFVKTYEAPDGTQMMHASMTFVSDELNLLLASGIDMIKFLVAMYNKRDTYYYKTKKSGIYEIPYPHFNLLGAAVSQWFGASLASDMTSTGFLARCIVIYEDQKRGKYPDPKMTPEQKAARSRIADTLYAIGDLYGEIHMTKETKKLFNKWYMQQDVSPAEDYRMAGYLERRTKIYILKVAALFAISALRQEITPEDLKHTFHVFGITEQKMRLAYMIAGSNRLAPFIPRISAILADAGGELPIRDVVSKVYTELDGESFKSVINTMQLMELVKVIDKDRETTLVELKPELLDAARSRKSG